MKIYYIHLSGFEVDMDAPRLMKFVFNILQDYPQDGCFNVIQDDSGFLIGHEDKLTLDYIANNQTWDLLGIRVSLRDAVDYAA